MYNRPGRARRRSLPDCSAKEAALKAARQRRSSASEVSDGLAHVVPSSPELTHKKVCIAPPPPPRTEESKRKLPTLSGEIISMILDHALQLSDFGDNARWSPNRQQAKERWIAAYRVGLLVCVLIRLSLTGCMNTRRNGLSSTTSSP